MPAATANPTDRPRWNFVVVMTDDQGRWAMPHRMPELVMPQLDQLLTESLELDRMYCASPVCSPSRASVMTGRIPSAHGIHDWLIGDRSPVALPDRYLEGQPTTAESLAAAGYHCGMAGKWHVGSSQQPAPGFGHWYAHRYGGSPYYQAPIWRDGRPAVEERYFTTAVTDEAVRFLHERDDQRPFYLQVNYTAPHAPWIGNHPADLLDLYDGCRFDSIPRTERHSWSKARADFDSAFADPVPHLAGYCASLTAVDDGLGRLRAALAATGAAESTIIVYLSDNGFSCGHHGIWGKGNGTMPLNFWDNSVRVPCLVHLPGGPTGVSDQVLSSAFLHATIHDLADLQPPDDSWGIGTSFGDLLRGADTTDRPEVVSVISEYGNGRMITDGRYVLIERPHGPNELYDHAEDPHELDNRWNSGVAVDVSERLHEALEREFAARTRPGMSGLHQPVSGYGQLNALTRGLPAEATFATADAAATPSDGVA